MAALGLECETTAAKGHERSKVFARVRYLTSLHWSLTQFTPASMDVSARNEWERVMSILVPSSAFQSYLCINCADATL